MAQGRGHRRGPRALTRGVVAACGRGLKAIVIIGPATFALCLWHPLNSNPWNFQSVISGKVTPSSWKYPDNPDMRARPPDNMKE